jgi:hypothetical protein
MKSLVLQETEFGKEFFQSMTIEYFKEHYFRRNVLHIETKAPNFYSSIFKRGELSKLLTSCMFHRPSVRLIGDGRVLPMSEITRHIPYGKYAFENVVDLEKVKIWYEKGYSINVRAGQNSHNGLKTATSLLSKLFGCNIRANIYATPAGKAGLVPHYDVHDVLILQIEGIKRWSLYENNFNSPTNNNRFTPEGFNTGERVKDIDLKRGDLLYLPRGTTHSAIALDESLHITIGIEEPTLVDIMHSLILVLERNEDIRKNVDCYEALRSLAYRKESIQSIGLMHEHLEDKVLIEAISLALKENLERSLNQDSSFLNGL